ncbi:KipI family sensor histidine kinase inhibitor [Pacificibacter maritimus]|uniref:KipI family sensor histidine kinase inhibitor n=1 Tax=Pacificibacter maritimus TaxID=762213 RepID=A0A3N4UNF0_9RHOB|nr:5-oxoprolinase subunit PxpB [Pacificibacter maritimus]RPE66557.1 KipI family sensor histidine kinase inhibitor [Pacificibacter maritimus]
MSATRLSMIGSRAVLFEVDCPFDLTHQERIWALTHAASTWDGVLESVPGMTNLTLLLDHVPQDLDRIERDLCDLWNTGKRHEVDGKLLEIDLTYGGSGGPHLAEVAQMTDMTIDQVIKLHSASDYTVYAVGSHAGYCYLGGLDPRLETPRRKVPLPRLPGGSLSVAGLQTGVSASAGPSGWNTIGSAEVSFFDPNKPQPALLQPGDRIRFLPKEVIA